MTTISEIQTAHGLCAHSHAPPAIFKTKQQNRSKTATRTHLPSPPGSIWTNLGESELNFGLKERSRWYVRHDTKNLDNVMFSAHRVRAGQAWTSCRESSEVDTRQNGSVLSSPDSFARLVETCLLFHFSNNHFAHIHDWDIYNCCNFWDILQAHGGCSIPLPLEKSGLRGFFSQRRCPNAVSFHESRCTKSSPDPLPLHPEQ
ncbi:hypothetical protein BaRGS_00015659 [Batillaria attramentaria]|uniref:Uncharacterized protein n=1 Tax=Batillaria attramentaria TaxID=370345 RepID=A0ABD0L1F3_9CAEN